MFAALAWAVMTKRLAPYWVTEARDEAASLLLAEKDKLLEEIRADRDAYRTIAMKGTSAFEAFAKKANGG